MELVYYKVPQNYSWIQWTRNTSWLSFSLTIVCYEWKHYGKWSTNTLYWKQKKIRETKSEVVAASVNKTVVIKLFQNRPERFLVQHLGVECKDHWYTFNFSKVFSAYLLIMYSGCVAWFCVGVDSLRSVRRKRLVLNGKEDFLFGYSHKH